MQADGNLFSNPVATLQEMRELGVRMVRVTMPWSVIAPDPGSRHAPKFNATNPNAYPAAGWGYFDAIDRDAKADGIQVMFVVTGFAPLWAQGPNPGRYAAKYSSVEAFEPSAADFGQFVRAAGTRYSGTFKPPGSVAALPRVRTWELYNEPNFGEDLAPQAIDHSQVLWAPVMYRGLLNAAWGALRATGHGHDTILIGALAARGAQTGSGRHRPQGLPGTYGETKPLSFIRALYCVNASDKEYRGKAAAARHCPTTAAASRRFRARNPALFDASGVSDHPYPTNQPPNKASSNDPSYTDLSQFPNLYGLLDRIQKLYGSHKRFPIWNTEYGYITNPPNASAPSTTRFGSHYVSPATAASYLNWAEYLSWRNPRIATTMQFLLEDPNPTVGTPEYGGFSSGLIYYPTVLQGVPKATFYAYRMPLFMPSRSTRKGRTLEVWGAVRPAPYASADTHQRQTAQIQFAPSGGSFTTVKTVTITSPEGYFDVHVAFPSSGSVRIAWSYPPADALLGTVPSGPYVDPLSAVYSRTVQVTIK